MNHTPKTYIILPTEVAYIENIIFSTVTGEAFLFELFGHVSELPTVTSFDFNLTLN